MRKAFKTTVLAMVACCLREYGAIHQSYDRRPGLRAGTCAAPEAAAPASHTASMSVEEQVEAMKKLKELVDIGIPKKNLMQKHEIFGL